MKYSTFGILLLTSVFLAGCGLDSKVDQFLSETASGEVIQKPIAGYTGGSSSVSEDILLGNRPGSQKEKRYGSYDIFSHSGLDQALGSGQRVVLMGYEEECDACVLLDRSISESRSRIPQDVVIFKTDTSTLSNFYEEPQRANTVVYLLQNGDIQYLSEGGMRSLDDILFYLH